MKVLRSWGVYKGWVPEGKIALPATWPNCADPGCQSLHARLLSFRPVLV